MGYVLIRLKNLVVKLEHMHSEGREFTANELNLLRCILGIVESVAYRRPDDALRFVQRANELCVRVVEDGRKD
jgi:hypothetical protein